MSSSNNFIKLRGTTQDLFKIGDIDLDSSLVGTPWSWIFPTGPGTAGQVLTSQAGGQMTWGAPTAAAAGSTNQLQFNTGGVLGASTKFTIDDTLGKLTVGKGVSGGRPYSAIKSGDVMLTWEKPSGYMRGRGGLSYVAGGIFPDVPFFTYDADLVQVDITVPLMFTDPLGATLGFSYLTNSELLIGNGSLWSRIGLGTSSDYGLPGQVLTSGGYGGHLSWTTPNSDSTVPFYISVGETFTVNANRQALFAVPITVDGDLVVDGLLIQV